MDVVYSSLDCAVIDKFLPTKQFNVLKNEALTAPYEPYQDTDGTIYERCHVFKEYNDGVVKALETFHGRELDFLGMGLRLNYDGEPPNKAIHSDLGWGEWALVLYISKAPAISGTAFWEHQPTSTDRIETANQPLLKAIGDDWNNIDKWKQKAFILGKPNRAAIYRSSLYHSRWPLEAYGTSPEDGRSICVAFYS